MTPSRRIQSRIDSIESSIERMKQAEHCGFSSKPTLNQTGELKEAYWLTRIAFSSASKVSASSSVGEVAARPAPAADRVDDAADHLLDAALALGRAEPPAEVLLRDDVRRGLRPEARELDVPLLEGRAVLARDDRVAELPLDLVERVASGDREEAPGRDRRRLLDDDVHDLVLRGCCVLHWFLGLLCGRHSRPLDLRLVRRSQVGFLRATERIGDVRPSTGRRQKPHRQPLGEAGNVFVF